MSSPPPRLPAGAQRAPIVSERVRAIGGQSFAFIPHRFLRDGFFASLSAEQLQLYVFLVLAADRPGVSFYHYDSICSLLAIPLERYLHARNALIAKDLIAFDGTRFQVLALPPRPQIEPAPSLTTAAQFEDHDPATIRQLLHHSLPKADSNR
jgi:hypothetical protein